MNRGFTLFELVVSIAIFALMTALVVAKFGNFNQSTLLTDTAYDVALALHTAQNYGLSVKNVSGASNPFGSPYGIDFDTSSSGASCGTVTSNNTHLVLYADSYPIGTPDGVCGLTDTAITTYAITRGAILAPTASDASSGLCVGSGTSCSVYGISELDVSYVRPNPEAKICASSGSTPTCGYTYAQITIHGSDGSPRSISVLENGQISVNP